MKTTVLNSISKAHYLIIGNGKVARHFSYYFSLLNISFSQWDRSSEKNFFSELKKSTHVLVLISDDAIEDFIQSYLKKANQTIIHFSGSLNSNLAIGAHPLQTFGPDLYDLESYKKVPFILDQNLTLFSVMPGLQNPFYFLDKVNKNYYHALCVMGGNFTTLLWQHVLSQFQELGLPASAAWPFLEQTVKNIQKDYSHALTGPIERRDKKTIQKNLDALNSDEYQKIYKSFLEIHFPEGLSL